MDRGADMDENMPDAGHAISSQTPAIADRNEGPSTSDGEIGAVAGNYHPDKAEAKKSSQPVRSSHHLINSSPRSSQTPPFADGSRYFGSHVEAHAEQGNPEGGSRRESLGAPVEGRLGFSKPGIHNFMEEMDDSSDFLLYLSMRV
ncbi:MAG: hypothetical protein Q9186_001969 [Xanthomendoza sp. 1 TL-2023]